MSHSARWRQLILGLIVMMSISSPQYVWTLFVKPLQSATGAALPATQFTFSLLIVLQTLFSPAQGFLVDRFGPRALIAVGADGARSFIRRALDIPFEGETYPEITLLLTTLFPFEDHLEGLSNVTYCWKAGGNFSLLKVPGRWRVSIYPREDLPIEEQLADKMIQASMNDIVPRSEPWVLNEKRDYRVHQRIVPTYVRGRVALAGDAAHLNSPSGGMGLNGGIQDAFELAAALTDILGRGAPLSRLDLYDRRRRPIARDQIIAQADRNRARMREKDPARRMEMLAELQAITADRARLRDYLLKSSMIEGLRQAARIV